MVGRKIFLFLYKVFALGNDLARETAWKSHEKVTNNLGSRQKIRCDRVDKNTQFFTLCLTYGFSKL